MLQRLFRLSVVAAVCCSVAPQLFAQQNEKADEKKADEKAAPQREIKWNNPDGPNRPGIEHRSFMSPSMEKEIGYNVWLPPDYSEGTARYPVIYFLHGAGGNENSDGPGFSQIVARLIEARKIPPVICVFPNGGMSGYRDNPATKIMGETSIVGELVPLIDKDFRTKPTRDARLISGFSMGGGGALRLALKHPDVFSAAASFAGAIGGGRRGGNAAPPAEIQVENLRTLGGKVRLLMIVGDKDQTFAGHKPLVDNLEEVKYPHKFHVLEGIGHSLGDYYRLTGEEMVLFLADGLPRSAAEPGPAPSAVRGSQFPRLNGDGTVTFRARAPKAQSVQILPKGDHSGLGDKPIDLKQDGDAWTVTTPVTPGFHYYSLVIDGFEGVDPTNQTYFGWARECSALEVPDPNLTFYTPRDVPHGDVRVCSYQSKVAGGLRRVFVYVPPGYDSDRDRRYPVLYLQHGSGENERGWSEQGRCNVILDNLIAEKRAVPMLIVMENGYPTPPDQPPAARGAAGAGGRGGPAPPDRFGEMVVKDLIPFIDGKFRTLADRENRAIGGLSMGGGQAVRTGFANLETFASIACLSGGIGGNFNQETSYNGTFKNVDEGNKRVRLFWFGSGTEDRAITGARSTHEALKEKKIDHVLFETSGAHEWQVWRKSLYDLAPRLFRDKSVAAAQ